MENDCALQALFPHFPPQATTDGYIESNPENYKDGSLKPCDQSIQLPIYNGMRVCFTRNVGRDIDFVNGMGGIVELGIREFKLFVYGRTQAD